MNTFSIAVSRRLREIGVEGETGFYWQQGYQEGKGDSMCSFFELSNIKTVDRKGMRCFPAYTLHDILRLMPKIDKKMGWETIRCGNCGAEGWTKENECLECDKGGIGLSGKGSYDYSRLIFESFYSGDYPEAEKVLLDLLK